MNCESSGGEHCGTLFHGKQQQIVAHPFAVPLPVNRARRGRTERYSAQQRAYKTHKSSEHNMKGLPVIRRWAVVLGTRRRCVGGDAGHCSGPPVPGCAFNNQIWRPYIHNSGPHPPGACGGGGGGDSFCGFGGAPPFQLERFKQTQVRSGAPVQNGRAPVEPESVGPHCSPSVWVGAVIRGGGRGGGEEGRGGGGGARTGPGLCSVTGPGGTGQCQT